MRKFKEHLLESADIADYTTARNQEGLYLGFAAIGFRFSNNPGADANKNMPYVLGYKNDNWFRKTEGNGKGYGLAIRKIKVTSRLSHKMGSGSYTAFKAKIAYIPSSIDEDEPTKYKTDDFWIFVHENFKLEDVMDFIDKNIGNYVP